MFNEQSQKYLFGSSLLEVRLELSYTRISSIYIIITSSSITGIIYHHTKPSIVPQYRETIRGQGIPRKPDG